MSLLLADPGSTIESITAFIRDTFAQQKKETAVVAVSGGIDSAVSLTLTTRALGADQVIPVFLPHHTQDTGDAELVTATNHIPEKNWQRVDISPIVTAATNLVDQSDEVRRGNLKARARMMVLYDLAKQQQALVVGTENKSEKYLGYFTRFGDEASDVEPIQHLYKTQVRQLAAHLELPEKILSKAPSAGLWQGQTDEAELGFSYDDADRVLAEYIDEQAAAADISFDDIDEAIVQKVIARVDQMAFKHQVPYVMAEH